MAELRKSGYNTSTGGYETGYYQQYPAFTNPVGFAQRPSQHGTPADLSRLRFERASGQNPSAQLIYDTSLTSDRRARGGSSATFNRNRGFSGGGSIGASFGGYNVPRINLDPFRRAQIAASEALNKLKFQGIRTELEGGIAQERLSRDFSLQQLERQLRGQREDISRDVLSRGVLHSGSFIEQTMEAETAGAEQASNIIASAAAQIGGLQSQIALLGAQRAATIASERAAIEAQYAMARAAG